MLNNTSAIATMISAFIVGKNLAELIVLYPVLFI